MPAFTDALIPGLWLAWLLFWAVARALRTKPVLRRESLASRLTHQLPLVIGVALLAGPRLADAALGARFLPRSVIGFWLGVALLGAGLLFAVAARIRLAGNWSNTVTLKQDHSLVRDGPYRWVRHPIYSGLLLAVLGTAVAIGEWRGLLALALITGAACRKLTIEEQFMQDAFGVEYAAYRRQVAALIPGIF